LKLIEGFYSGDPQVTAISVFFDPVCLTDLAPTIDILMNLDDGLTQQVALKVVEAPLDGVFAHLQQRLPMAAELKREDRLLTHFCL
jgi:hypothetical protein